MCSFTFLRIRNQVSKKEIVFSNFYSRFRGPDVTNIRRETAPDGWNLVFLHNLLDISGHSTSQPVEEGTIGKRLFALFNGEIYNYKDFTNAKSDTSCILPLYASKGQSMGQDIDGEFSILIYDESENTATILTDPFLTKPLYIAKGSIDGDFGVSTCLSSLARLGFDDVHLASPNSSYTVSFSSTTIQIEHRFPVFLFNINQHQSTYKFWQDAFVKAVQKRASHGAFKPTVFLSSGYDSGGICGILNYLNTPYNTFSIIAGESKEVLSKRIVINSANCHHPYLYNGISAWHRKILQADIKANVENFKYWHEDSPGLITALHDDHGAVGANFLASKARAKKCFVVLSGSGADEILSDYGFNGEKIYHHSQFGGLFPTNLEGFFPWNKFYGDTQRSYLFKDEYILGRHGLEGRYPFLDRQVVQEFLALTPDLKNRIYKAPLDNLLGHLSYPFEPGIKRGFCPNQSDSRNNHILSMGAKKIWPFVRRFGQFFRGHTK